MTRFQFLVPVDGSDNSINAAKHAVELASKYGAEVSSIFVVDKYKYRISDIFDIVNKAGEEYVSQVRKMAQDKGVTVKSTKVLSGSPVDQIVNEAKAMDANLIVIAAIGGSGSTTSPIGFIANRVMRHTHSHILLVRHTDNNEQYKQILIATDGSADAKYGAQYAMSIARRYNAKVYACTIINSKDRIIDRHVTTLEEAGKGKLLGEPVTYTHEIIKRLREHMLKDAASVTDDIKDIAKKKDVTVETIVRDGKTASEILKIVKNKKIDLVVLGSHGKGTVSKMRLGSISEKIASTARCSVLIVRGTRIERVVPE